MINALNEDNPKDSRVNIPNKDMMVMSASSEVNQPSSQAGDGGAHGQSNAQGWVAAPFLNGHFLLTRQFLSMFKFLADSYSFFLH